LTRAGNSVTRELDSVREPSRVERAARNNAVWCDAVCRAHGVAGEFFDAIWRNCRSSPPYYPNLVTFRDTYDRGDALDHVRHLVAVPLPGMWSIKDSFCDLDLAALGFEILFEASWIWLEPALGKPMESSPEFQWSRIMSSSDLAHWEAAWSIGRGEKGVAGGPRQFPSSLLVDSSIVFLAGYKGKELVAGGVLNHTEGVVGMSNVFAPASGEFPVWAALVGWAQLAFPGMPLVGYERASNLDAACKFGFETVGNLRVWRHRDGAGQASGQAVYNPGEASSPDQVHENLNT